MRTFGIVALLVLGVLRIAHAERLLVPLGALPSGDTPPGLSRVQTLGLDRGGLAALRGREAATVEGFPLGGDGPAVLDLVHFDPFLPAAKVEIVEAGGPRAGALPDKRYYRGTVRGDADSRVLVVVLANAVRGFVATGGTVYRFGPDASGVHRSYAMRDVDPTVFPGPGAFCANGDHPEVVNAPSGHTAVAASPPPTAGTPPVAAFSPTLLVEVAIETDQELRGKFASDADTLDYLSDLAAAASAIYDTDTNVRVGFRSVRIWNTTDPWTATATLGMLNEVQNYWVANEGATPRDVVHFVSGKNVIGGIAYLGVLCDPGYGYGVSTVYGTFDVLDPDDTWDVVVVTHELGHNFGSPHTHCYMPPVDTCYSGEAGCYSGPTSLPPGGGTIMSYCHLLSGGISNVNLTFGATVSAVLRTGAESGICVGPPCPDGILDPGEDCDDGNYDAGDCCSPTCTAEPDGNACDDDNVCTGPDQCASGACVGTPATDGDPCDDDNLCTSDTCQGGACIGAPDPAPGCKLPIQALKAQITMKDKSPDKGDQVVWKWTKGADTSLGELGTPLATDDYALCVYGAGPTSIFSAHMAAGGTCNGVPCWKTAGTTGFTYKNKARTPDGAEKLTLKSGIGGAAKMTFKGKADLLVMPALGAFPLPVRVQLRHSGGPSCWEAFYSTPLVNTTAQFKAKSDP